MAWPTRLPLFKALAKGVLSGIGWTWTQITNPNTDEPTEIWVKDPYPSFANPDVSAEVLFGTLHRFGVQFVEELTDLFDHRPANAVHHVAVDVLAAGGCVWTTNVDTAVEAASDVPVQLAARGFDRAPHLLRPLTAAGPATLVKLHGTVACPETMAFTDLELMSPLQQEIVDHLSALTAGRTVVFYGYAAADADLAELLDSVLMAARRVVWFEPDGAVQQQIRRALRHSPRIEFHPLLEDPLAFDAVTMTADFAAFAQTAGVKIPDDLLRALLANDAPPDPPDLPLAEPSGITHARLVERFGRSSDNDRALQVARRADLRGIRVGSLPEHLRWSIRRSLYNDGSVAHAVRSACEHERLLSHVRPRRLRDYVITRNLALLLQDRDPVRVGDFADWATTVRADGAGNPYAVDLYYRAYARRYELHPALTAADADEATAGLSAPPLTDPERLAGALLESGCAAVYQGRFEDAVLRGFDLRERRGRYAISRWRGWGAWLETIAYCHRREPDAAAEALQEARRRFAVDERKEMLLRDVRTAELLLLRVRVALRQADAHDGADLRRQAAADQLDGRYRDDRDLILADLDLAAGDSVSASQRLSRVAADPSCAVAAGWARLGLAELDRLTPDRQPLAADAFDALARDARDRAAWWLQTQAVIGLALCRDGRADEAWQQLRRVLPDVTDIDDPLAMSFGDPRVLWLMTL